MQQSWEIRIPNQKGKKGQKVRHQKTVTRPSARSTIIRNTAPAMRGSNGQVRIVHREFVGSYKFDSGSTNWSLVGRADGYDINPGSSALFPWLAPMAINFERFRFNSLKFKVASAAATNTTGRLYLTVDYDWDDPLPSDKREFVNKQHTVSGPCWQDLALTCNPRLIHADMPWKYVKSPSRADPEPRTNYGGFILVACDAASTSAHFDFWVEYDVTLSTPDFDNVDPEFLSRPEYSTTTLTSPTSQPTGGNILQIPMPASGTNFVRATIPNSPAYAGVPLSQGIDIRKVNAGNVTIRTKLCEIGVSPAAVIDKLGTVATCRVFDALGGHLGDITTGSTTAQYGVEQHVAVEDLKALSTPGAYVEWLVTIFPEFIKQAYSAAAYIAVFNNAFQQIGPSKASSNLASTLRPL